eukprot:scaffold41496_cov26-Tisochrysis_lutea.AAC.6
MALMVTCRASVSCSRRKACTNEFGGQSGSGGDGSSRGFCMVSAPACAPHDRKATGRARVAIAHRHEAPSWYHCAGAVPAEHPPWRSRQIRRAWTRRLPPYVRPPRRRPAPIGVCGCPAKKEGAEHVPRSRAQRAGWVGGWSSAATWAGVGWRGGVDSGKDAGQPWECAPAPMCRSRRCGPQRCSGPLRRARRPWACAMQPPCRPSSRNHGWLPSAARRQHRAPACCI